MTASSSSPNLGKPLHGLTVLEFSGKGPGPFCGMLLSDMGADVICVRRPEARVPGPHDFDQRGRRNIILDLKEPGAVGTCLALCETADVLIEGFRPGVMERLGMGPEQALQRNPRLIYGRITGWGQSGPYAQMPGHDLNYAAITGAISSIGPQEAPAIPLNLIADYGGGAMFLACGVLAALFQVRETGRGQVIDAAMSDGAAYLMTAMYMLRARGQWNNQRSSNLLDGGAPYYRCYRCADGEWISIAALEDPFFAQLAAHLDIPRHLAERRSDPACWPELGAFLERAFLTAGSTHWKDLLEPTAACFAPILSMAEAPLHPHNLARETFRNVGGHPCPSPAPRFLDWPGAAGHLPSAAPDGAAPVDGQASAVLPDQQEPGR